MRGERSADEMLANGGMEEPFAQGLAQGWVPNNYGENIVSFAPEYTDRHGGRSAQRVTCTRFASGGVQFHSGRVSVARGQPYTLRLWMKGTVTSPVYVGVRQHGAPYTPYLRRDLRATRQWRPYVITGPSVGTDPDCGIYIMFAGTGTLLVDDVSLMPGIHPEVAETPGVEPRKGNRIYNSGFEAGPEGWASASRFTLDPASAHSGRMGAALPGGALESRPFAVRAGMRYTLTAWTRAAGGDGRVTLRLREWADTGEDSPANRNELSAAATVGREWTRCQVSGVVVPNLWDHYVARVEATGPVQVDDVQVEEGAAADYAPQNPVEVGAQTATRACTPGDPVEVRSFVSGPASGALLSYTLEDAWSRPVQTWRQRISGPAGTLRLRAPRPGIYRVRVRAQGTSSSGEVWFGVFPAARTRNAAFGAHVTGTTPAPSLALRETAGMGVGWVRLHDFGDFCHWYRVEPEKGRWVWHDAEIDGLRAQGFTLIGNLGHPPLWAGRADPRRQDNGAWTNAPPRDMEEWEEYVTRTVAHYRGRIRHWEIWNEPYWVGFFCGTPEEYADLLRVASGAIRRADPQAVILGGCFAPGNEEWTRPVLARGSLQWMDALSYHVYWTPGATEPQKPGEPPLLEREARQFVALMREAGAPKPVWMTEGGVGSPPFASWLPSEAVLGPSFAMPQSPPHTPITGLTGAGALVKGLAEMRGAGVEVACYYYVGQENGAPPWFSTIGNGAYVLMDFDGRPKAAMMAYSALTRMLEGAKPAGSVTADGLRAYVFRQGGGSVAVAWSKAARSLSVRGAALYDMMGNPMPTPCLRPGEPVYLRAPRLAPAELGQRLREGPVKDGRILPHRQRTDRRLFSPNK